MRSTVSCTLCQKHTGVCSYSQWTFSRDTRGCSNAAGHLYSAWLVPSIFREFCRPSFFPSVSPVKWNCSANAATALYLFSLARSQSCESTTILFSPLLPLCRRATWNRATRWRRSAARPTLALFSYGFSPPPTLADPLSSLPATSFSSAAAIPAPVASLTNRAAREYIFYRHSWWPPRICANLSA